MAINGLVVMTPSSIAYSGTSASINADGSVDFSAVTSLSLNGVFTSAYDNYMVVMRYVSGTNDAMNFRLRASGTDNSTANSYVTQSLDASSTAINASRTTSNLGIAAALASAQRSGFSFYCYGPYLAQPTAFRSINPNGISDARLDDRAGTHNQSTSYDGISFIAASNNFSGLLTVFGFNQ